MTLEQAEEATQDVLALTLERPDWLSESRGSILAALKTTLRNRWYDQRRRQSAFNRITPKLRLVTPPRAPERHLVEERAAQRRRAFLSLLTPEERAVFRAWIAQRNGQRANELAPGLGLTPPAYEAAKKRLRRRCQRILEELEMEVSDLFGTGGLT